MDYELKPNSIPNEYYCGDLPGTLQYKKSLKALQRMNTNYALTPQDAEWTYELCGQENADRLLPHTQKKGDWRIVHVMKRVRPNETWLKGALINRQTGEIALMTSCSRRESIIEDGNRAMESHAEDWSIGHYRMGAPIVFWKSLQDVLKTIE
jgi:hypothetical protein